MPYQELLNANAPLTEPQEDLCWAIHEAIISHTHRLADAECQAYMRDERSALTPEGQANLSQPFYEAAQGYIAGDTPLPDSNPLPAPSDPVFPWISR